MPTLKPQSYAGLIEHAFKGHDGRALAQHFDLRDAHGRYLYESLPPNENSLDYGNPSYIETYSRKLKSPWAEMATLHTQALIALNDKRMDPVTQRARYEGDAMTAYVKQHEVTNTLYRWLMSSSAPTGWVLPLLYVVCRDLRRVATLADEQRVVRGEKALKLEETSRLLQKCFSACLNDRSADEATSRKYGTYYLAVLLFKTYFQLKATALCRNVIKGIGAVNLPPLHSFPIAHQVSYNYYMGVFAFLREDYAEAETKFLASLRSCHAKSTRNIELILDYLVPILLLRGVLPSPKLLRKARSRLAELYGPFVEAFKTGNVALYDQQLKRGEKRLMQRGTYLVVERAREGAVRALMKAAWILEGKPARVSVDTFRQYYARGAGIDLDAEEMECILANLVYKGRIRGYISHAHQLVVLSKDRPFPWYAPFAERGEAARVEREARQLAVSTGQATAGVRAMEIS